MHTITNTHGVLQALLHLDDEQFPRLMKHQPSILGLTTDVSLRYHMPLHY